MRTSEFGTIEGISKSFPTDISLKIFEKMCLVRYFELGIINAIDKGLLKYPVYLSSGQESIAVALSIIVPNYMIFAQHRCHDIYLAMGGSPERLRDELLGLPTGTSGGRAGSNCIQCHSGDITMFGHHGLIGENVSLGVGAALGSGKPTLCIFGDGAAEEDYILTSIGFAITHKLPVLFMCTDNNLSILTPVKTRRSWNIADVIRGFDMMSFDITDDPWQLIYSIANIKEDLVVPGENRLPAFINCYTCRKYWHCGTGTDGTPEWDRFKLVKKELKNMGLIKKINKIENKIKKSMEKLWDLKLLQKLLNK